MGVGEISSSLLASNLCLNQGTNLGWLIDPEVESVITFQPDQLPSIVIEADVLPVLKSLENLQLRVNQLFSWLTL